MCNAEAGDATPLEVLLGAIQRFVSTPGPETTPTQLGEHLIRLRHGIDLLELDFASSAAIFAATDEYENQGSVSPYDWIRHNCHMSGQAVSRALTAGEQFGRLPAVPRAGCGGDRLRPLLPPGRRGPGGAHQARG